MRWVCGCAMHLCTCVMSLRSQSDTGHREGSKGPQHEAGAPQHMASAAWGVQPSSPGAIPWDSSSLPGSPPSPLHSPPALSDFFTHQQKKSEENSEGLNVVFHQFSSTFGVSAAAFSPDSCSSPLKKSSFVVYCHQYLDGNNPLLILHLISWI